MRRLELTFSILLEEWANCIAEIDKSFQHWGFDYDLSVKKVYCLIYLSDIHKTISWLTEIEEQHYFYPFDYNNIGWTLYERKLDRQYSAKLLRKAVEGDLQFWLHGRTFSVCWEI